MINPFLTDNPISLYNLSVIEQMELWKAKMLTSMFLRNKAIIIAKNGTIARLEGLKEVD